MHVLSDSDIPHGGKIWQGEMVGNLANDHKFAKFSPTKFIDLEYNIDFET